MTYTMEWECRACGAKNTSEVDFCFKPVKCTCGAEFEITYDEVWDEEEQDYVGWFELEEP